jgi:hypothetical protein
MKKYFIPLFFAGSFILSGCNNPTSTSTTTTQTATATVEQSAFILLVNSIDKGTTYEAGYLEYIWAVPSSVIIKEGVYIHFYTPQIPSGATIESATLNIWITTLDAVSTTTITQVNGAWDRTTITSTNEPALGSVRGFEDSSVGWNDIDITLLVREWVDGTSANYGVKIFPSACDLYGSNKTRFQDHDDAQYYPRIVVKYH